MTKPTPPDDTIIFIHILKTGGITINSIIEKHYSPSRSYSTYPSARHPHGSLEEFKQMTTAQKRNIDVLYGHMNYGLHEDLPRAARYFTILRDPIERVISRYYHIHRNSEDPLHDKIQSGEMDMIGFIEYMANAGRMDNLQTRIIAGNWELRGYGECTKEMLEVAKSNLRNQFVIVGLTERFDETCLLIQRNFGWKDIYYTKRNVTKNRPQQEALSDDTLHAIQQYNQFDVELYKYATTLFEEQVHAQGSSFTRDVKIFQWKNGRFSSLRKSQQRIRTISARTYAKNIMKQLRK